MASLRADATRLLEEIVDKHNPRSTEILASHEVTPRPLVYFFSERISNSLNLCRAGAALIVLLGPEFAESGDSLIRAILGQQPPW